MPAFALPRSVKDTPIKSTTGRRRVAVFPRALIRTLTLLCLLTAGLPAFGQGPKGPLPWNPAFYDYDAHAPFTATERPLREINGIRVSIVTYPSPVVTPFALNNTVTAYLFLPPGPGPHPAMLVLHEWLPRTLDNEFRMCEAIARARVAALLIVQPYSLNRRPVPHRPEAELLSADVPQMVAGLRQAVLDARRGLDWLSRRPDIDSNRLGVSGISLGGILAPLVAGVDQRAKVVLTFVGGADVADIVWESPMLHGMHQGLIDHGYGYKSLKWALAPLEASNWLHGFDPRNALLFNGRYDIFVLPKQAERLSKALGGAPIVWSNTGHYGLALTEAEAEKVGAAFLQSRFFPDAPPFTPPRTLASRTIKLGLLIGGREGVSPDLACQIYNFDEAGRYSVDGQLTLHGLSAALSTRLGLTTAAGIEFPLFHGPIKPRPYLLLHIVL